MSAKETTTRSVRLNARTNRHLMAASRYFNCSIGELIALMFDATRISQLEIDISDEIIDKFYQEVNSHVDAETYLFKD